MPHPIIIACAVGLFSLAEVSTYQCLDGAKGPDCSGLEGLREARMFVPSSASNYSGDIAVVDTSIGEERRAYLLLTVKIDLDKD